MFLNYQCSDMVPALRNPKTLTKKIFTTMMFGNSKVMFFTIAQVFEGRGDENRFNFFLSM